MGEPLDGDGRRRRARGAEATAEQALRVAAELLEASPADLVLRDGRVEVTGAPGRGVSLGEVAAACDPVSSARRGEAPGLGAAPRFADAPMTYPYGVHLAQVEVDRDTGGVDVMRYFVAYEVGRAVNPTLVEGQLVGGVAQGLGGALLEELAYDDSASRWPPRSWTTSSPRPPRCRAWGP